MAVGMGGEPLSEFSASPRLMGCWEEEEEKLQGGSLSQIELVLSSPLQRPFSMHTGSGGEGGVWCQSEVLVPAANDIESAFRTDNPEL